ncbi:hypothetical protein Q8F55_001829 [Vanrija albida]|uniref:Uncharacterized protein n=1 Tax=Vanrija albida TaxID=181172 RepID=A0ABR3Q888_9TREE
MADNQGGIIVGGGAAATVGAPPPSTPRPSSSASTYSSAAPRTTTIPPVGTASSVLPTTPPALTYTPATPVPGNNSSTFTSSSSSSSSYDAPSNSTGDWNTSVTLSSYPAPQGPGRANGLPFSTPVLVGIVVAGVVLIASVGGCCWLLSRQRRRRRDDDDTFGMGIEWRRRSRAGYTRSDDPAVSRAPLPTSTIPRHALTSHEARDSVVRSGAAARSAHALVPPQALYRRDSTDRASTAWTDNSDMDVWAVAGSTAGARTMSTVGSRPNSEYSLDQDPGSTWNPHEHGTFGGSAGHPAFLPPMGGGALRPAPGVPVRSAPAPFVNSVHGSTAGYEGGTFNGYPLTSGGSTFGGYPASEGTFGGQQTGTGTYMSTLSSGTVQTPLSAATSHFPGARRQPPRLIVDAKGGQWSEPGSALSPAPSSSSAAYWQANPSAEYTAPYTPRAHTPRSGLVSAASSPAAYTGASAVRPLVQSFVRPMPVAAVNANQLDRPSALPYAAGTGAGAEPQSPPTGASLSRGMTIVRHADAGVAFQDAVPDNDDDDELHLPPAYGDIYGEPRAL